MNANPTPGTPGRDPRRTPEQSFVQGIDTPSSEAPNARAERIIVVCWCLIVLKSLFVWWASARWTLPFHPLWLIGPTVAMGLLGTAIYYVRRGPRPS